MIDRQHAQELREAGLLWRHPAAGDRFTMVAEEFAGEVFTVSEMTVESHEFTGGTILGFNGTTEWALDSVALDDALWMPRDDQLRGLLGRAFQSLVLKEGLFTATVLLSGAPRGFTAPDASTAYAEALLALIRDARG
ncbi:MAG TPA: pilus assembly protein CpaE [Microbacteriaceae bacterium]|nr:pilus assembly protein CpaE [Microbacteriaceae bacterium]